MDRYRGAAGDRQADVALLKADAVIRQYCSGHVCDTFRRPPVRFRGLMSIADTRLHLSALSARRS